MRRGMKTDDLIRVLARDPVIEPPVAMGRELGLAVVCASGVGLAFLAVFGTRPDLSDTLVPAALKIVVTALIACAGLALVSRLGQPGATTGGRLALLGVAGAVLATWSLVTMLADPGTLTAGLLADNALHCLVAIPVLAMPTLFLFVRLARRTAVTRPAFAGVAAGLAAAGLSAAFYSLSCTSDSPLFIALWYGLATVIVGAAGAAAFERFVRW